MSLDPAAIRRVADAVCEETPDVAVDSLLVLAGWIAGRNEISPERVDLFVSAYMEAQRAEKS